MLDLKELNRQRAAFEAGKPITRTAPKPVPKPQQDNGQRLYLDELARKLTQDDMEMKSKTNVFDKDESGRSQAYRAGKGVQSVGYSVVGALPYVISNIGASGEEWLANIDNDKYQEQKKRNKELQKAYVKQDFNSYYDNSEPINESANGAVSSQREIMEQGIKKSAQNADEAKIKHMVKEDNFGAKMIRKSQEAQAEATEGLGGISKFLVGTGLSMGRNLAVGIPTAMVAGPGAAVTAMGTMAAADKMYDVAQSGGGSREAFVRGIVSGGIEVITEKMPLDTIIDAIKYGGKNFVKQVLKQSGTEASEEAVAYVLNYVADIATKDPQAQFSLKELALSAAGGAVSGGVMGAGSTIIGNTVNGGNSGTKNSNLLPGENDVQQNGETPQHMKVGKATVIKSPYKGEMPVKIKNAPTNKAVVTNESLQIAKDEIVKAENQAKSSGKSLRNYLTDFYNTAFDRNGGAHGIVVDNIVFAGKPYVVTIHKNAISKVIADGNLSAEKAALLDVIDDVVENGGYVGSGAYEQHGEKSKPTTRFDYFETQANIGGTEYTVTFDVEVFPNQNNYRTHKVINNIDLVRAADADTVPLSAANAEVSSVETGHLPAALDTPPSLFNPNIPQSTSAVNTYDMQKGENDAQHDNMEKIKAEYKAASNPNIIQYVKQVYANPSDNGTLFPLGKISDRAAKEVGELVGFDISGYDTVINPATVIHIENRHGVNGVQDHSMADVNDLARINYVLENYDSVVKDTRQSKAFSGADGKGAQIVVYEKRINGSYYVIEAVPNSKAKTVHIVTVYKTKATPQAPLANAVGSTSDNAPMDVASDNPIVAQENNGVKAQYMQKSENNALTGVGANDTIVTNDTQEGEENGRENGKNPGGTGKVRGDAQETEGDTVQVRGDRPGQSANTRRRETDSDFLKRSKGIHREVARIAQTNYSWQESGQVTEQSKNTISEMEKWGLYATTITDAPEANRKDITYRFNGEAAALADGSVLIRYDSKLTPRNMAAHEAYHVALKREKPSAVAFDEAVRDNVDFSSEDLVDIAEDISQSYYGKSFMEIDDYGVFYDELGAYVAGELNDDMAAASEMFAPIFSDWGAVRTAFDGFKAATYDEDRVLGLTELDPLVMRFKNKNTKETYNKLIENFGVKGKTAKRIIKSRIEQIVDDLTENEKYSHTKVGELYEYLAQNSLVSNQEGLSEYRAAYDDIRKTRLLISDDVRGGIVDFGEFRKSNMGRLMLVDKDGQPIDTFYMEMARHYPGLFNTDVTHQADQIEIISDVSKMLKASTVRADEYYGQDYKEQMQAFFKTTIMDMVDKQDVVRKHIEKMAEKNADKENPAEVLAEREMNNFGTENLKQEYDKQHESISEELAAEIKNVFTFNRQITGVFDEVAGDSKELRKLLYDRVEKPLFDSKAEYTQEVKIILDAYFKSMKELGIKPKSRESAAVMWIGEGKRQARDSKGRILQGADYEEYTLQRLKKDFPEKWENIVAADQINRQIYDEFVEKINKGLSEIYPDPLGYINKQLDSLRIKREGALGLKARIDKQIKDNKVEDLTETLRQKNSYEREISTLSKNIQKLENDIKSGDALIGKRLMPRKDYYRHFMEKDFGWKAFGNIRNSSGEISPELVGKSEFTKPLSKFAGFMQRSTGNGEYTEDSIGAMLEYIPQAQYKASIEPNIKKIRVLAADIAAATKRTKNANKLIEWLTDYAGDLAGKTTATDRFLIKLGKDRKLLNTTKWINNRVRGNMVVGNVPTAISQVFNLPLALAKIKNPIDMSKGAIDFCTLLLGDDTAARAKARAKISKSAFLAERYLDSSFRQFEPKFTPKQFATWMMEFGDKFVAQYTWLAAYNQAERTGVTNAVEYADKLTRLSVGGRGIGELPLSQRSELVKLLAPFQVETNNTWQELKTMVKGKDLMGIFIFALASWLMNMARKEIDGRSTGLDIIGAGIDAVNEAKNTNGNALQKILAAGGRMSGEILSNMPFGSQLASMAVSDPDDRQKIFGENDPTRFGMGNVGIDAISKPLTDIINGKNMDIVPALASILPAYGGKQIERGVKALEDYGLIPKIRLNTTVGISAKKNPFPASVSEGGGLRFLLKEDPLTFAQNALLGPYSTKEGKAYVDDKGRPLTEKGTNKLYEANKMGIKPALYLKTKNEIDAIETKKAESGNTIVGSAVNAKRKYIYDLKLDDEKTAFLFDSLGITPEYSKEYEMNPKEETESTQDKVKKVRETTDVISDAPDKRIGIAKKHDIAQREYKLAEKMIKDVEPDRDKDGKAIPNSSRKKAVEILKKEFKWLKANQIYDILKGNDVRYVYGRID